MYICIYIIYRNTTKTHKCISALTKVAQEIKVVPGGSSSFLVVPARFSLFQLVPRFTIYSEKISFFVMYCIP